MLRGSSELIQKNSHIFGPIIKEFFSYVKTNNIVVDGSLLDQDKICQLRNIIQESKIPVSAIGITKILLGVFACTPAFDTKLKEGVRAFKREHKDDPVVKRLSVNLFERAKNGKGEKTEDKDDDKTLLKKDAKKLKDWIEFVNQPEVEIFFKETSPKFENSKKYPIMRTVDLYFWFLGHEFEKTKAKNQTSQSS